MYSLIMLFAKLALFLLYYRLFALHYWTKIAIYLGIITNGLWNVAFATACLILCVPWPGESWKSPKCSRTLKMIEIFTAFNAVSDLYLFILPLPVLRSLQMPPRRKLGVVATFSTGLM